jgi:hypothetical protein
MSIGTKNVQARKRMLSRASLEMGNWFSPKMAKLQRWVARKDVKWAKQIGIFQFH